MNETWQARYLRLAQLILDDLDDLRQLVETLGLSEEATWTLLVAIDESRQELQEEMYSVLGDNELGE